MDTPFVKLKIMPFPISLFDLDKELVAAFNRLVGFDHGQGQETFPLYWCWIKSANEGEVRFCFRAELTPEEESLFESIWNSLDEAEQQEKIERIEARPLAIENAKSAAVTSNWDQLTAEQKKLIIGAMLSEEDIDQLVEDFGSV